jgi:hypothetical protein
MHPTKTNPNGTPYAFLYLTLTIQRLLFLSMSYQKLGFWGAVSDLRRVVLNIPTPGIPMEYVFLFTYLPLLLSIFTNNTST